MKGPLQGPNLDSPETRMKPGSEGAFAFAGASAKVDRGRPRGGWRMGECGKEENLGNRGVGRRKMRSWKPDDHEVHALRF